MCDIKHENKDSVEGLEKAFDELESGVCEVLVPEKKTDPVPTKADDSSRVSLLEKQVTELKAKVEKKQKDFDRMLKIKLDYDAIIQKQMRMIRYMGERFKICGLDHLQDIEGCIYMDV